METYKLANRVGQCTYVDLFHRMDYTEAESTALLKFIKDLHHERCGVIRVRTDIPAEFDYEVTLREEVHTYHRVRAASADAASKQVLAGRKNSNSDRVTVVRVREV